MSRTASQTEVLLELVPRIDAPPDLVDDSDDDEMRPSLFQDSDNDSDAITVGARSSLRVGHRDDEGAIMLWEPLHVHGGRSLSGLRSVEAPRIHHIAIEHSDDDEMPALVADGPSFRGTCRSPAWGCAKPGRQG